MDRHGFGSGGLSGNSETLSPCPGTLFRQKVGMKSRLYTPCGTPNPRDTSRHHEDSRFVPGMNASIPFMHHVESFMDHDDVSQK
jgi:hypothetical protein